ncbi:MAG: RHS repeat-associated core domain-containing protein [Pseudomonadota bacterium]
MPITGISLGYEFDAVGNLKRLRDGNKADPPARIYGYDPLNRLTEAKDASDVVWQSYNYDRTGNRQNAGWRELVAQEDCTGAPPGGPCTPLPPAAQWSTDAYTYHPGTHRLFSRTGRERSYDSAGNLTLDAPTGAAPIDPPPGGGGTESAAYEGTMQAMEEEGGEEPLPPGAVSRTYSYNAANRMSGTSLGGEHLMSYRHNGRGERVYRQSADRTVHTVFDDAGRWIGDYDANGAIVQQAIWLGDPGSSPGQALPVGLLAKDGGVTRLFHIEADALGSPRVVIDPTRGARGTVVWRWDLAGEAFGNDKPNEDPDGDDVAFVLDMRFPGQQYDSAAGLNYNYFRDYEVAMGRYVQSDPIGLKGGISTFQYAAGAPTLNVDTNGRAHISGFTNANREAQVVRGLAEAREKIAKCQMGDCYPGLEPYFMTDADRRRILENLMTMTVVYDPNLTACGFARQFQSTEIVIGPATFTGACCLAATLAHEADHLGSNWGNGRGNTEKRPEYIEEKCFGCKGGFGK